MNVDFSIGIIIIFFSFPPILQIAANPSVRVSNTRESRVITLRLVYIHRRAVVPIPLVQNDRFIKMHALQSQLIELVLREREEHNVFEIVGYSNLRNGGNFQRLHLIASFFFFLYLL